MLDHVWEGQCTYTLRNISDSMNGILVEEENWYNEYICKRFIKVL